MKVSTTLYLLCVGSFAVTTQAAITWHSTCDKGRKTKVTQAFADASKMASTVIIQWDDVAVKPLTNYFSGVSSAQKTDIKQVFSKIADYKRYNFNVFCIYTYDHPDMEVLSLSKCANREVSYVDIKAKEATNDIFFCPPFFSSAINKFIDGKDERKEICSLNSNFKEEPLKEYKAPEGGSVPSRNYDQMIEWLAHAFPGKWALHELTHTLAIGDHLTSTKTMIDGGSFQKKGTTDVAYGKTNVKKLKGTDTYQNADSYAWMAWTVWRDVCKTGATAGEACSLTKRAGTGTGKGKGKGKGGAATPGKGPCNGKPPAKKPPVKNPAVKNPAVKNPAVKKPPVKTPLKKPAPGGKRPVPGGKRPVPGGKRPAPAVKKPAIKKPAAKKPAAKKPAAKKPAAKKTAAKKPAAKKPAAKKKPAA